MSDDVKVFKCPNCSQYINSGLDSCKFCETPLSLEVKQKAIEGEKGEAKAYRFNNSKKHLWIGIGVFALGIFLSLPGLLAGTFTDGGFIFIGILLIGLAEIGNGFYGLLDHWGDK